MNIVLIILDCLRLDKSEEIYEVLKKYGFYKLRACSCFSTKGEKIKKELDGIVKKFISRTKRRALELKLKKKATKLKGKI